MPAKMNRNLMSVLIVISWIIFIVYFLQQKKKRIKCIANALVLIKTKAKLHADASN